MNTLTVRRFDNPPMPCKQQGAVLLITLILMLMLTILALTEVSMNSAQIHLAANLTDNETSFEKAEAALNIGINSLLLGLYLPSNFQQNANGLYQFNANSAPLWTTVNWSNSSAVINSFQGGSGVQASYIIEQLPSVIQPGQSMSSSTNIYRITARSLGVNGNTAVILQATTQTQD